MGARRPLYGWLTAEAISLTGTRVSMIALPWFVLTTTGSATKTGLVALAEMLPLVVLKVLGGPVIDRVGARRVAITCDLLSVLAVGAIPLLHESGWLPFPLFLLLVALAGALRGPGDAAKAALTPAVVAEAGVPMERATGLHSTIERTSGLLGAAIAGGLVAVVGAADALVVDAVSFGLSAAVLAWATTSLRRPVASVGEEPEVPYRARLREGWTFLRGDRVLLGIAVMVALTNLLDLAYATVLVPVWAAETTGSAATVGLVFATFGGAAAIGAMCAAAWAARLPRYQTYLVAFLVCGAPRFVVFAVDAPMWAVLAVCVAGGFASGFLNPILGAVIYERIPDRLMGRVTSLNTALCFALMPFGGILGGLLVAGFGLSAALLVVGAAYFLVTMLPAVDPRWRELDRRPAPEPVSA
ncbi:MULTISPECIES: MFS transporter [unclassified Nocardioides]|uniref:MFS transporter n=1 Tax=unclassified Nocardioides TaxID=2615069 RepID=UPI000A2704BB|nr:MULTISPECIES: MFS transporter [unclassified Nocardioides]